MIFAACISALCFAIGHVVRLRSLEQMARVAACRVIATMQDHLTIIQRSVYSAIDDASSKLCAVIKTNYAIAPILLRRRPLPALFRITDIDLAGNPIGQVSDGAWDIFDALHHFLAPSVAVIPATRPSLSRCKVTCICIGLFIISLICFCSWI